MSAALEFEKAGQHASYFLLEKRQLFHTMKVWAKCKPLFYASTGSPQVQGELWRHEPQPQTGVRTGDLLAIWDGQLARYSLNALLGETVTDIQKTDKFRVVTDQGSYICDRVILCIGKLIYLQKLEVGAEALPKVFYEPPNPEEYRGRDVLVVGGGTNEALETALNLAPHSRVTLTYPDPELSGAEPEVVEAVNERAQAGQVKLLANARLQEVLREEVILETPAAPALRLKNDAVFPFLGIDKSELPVSFFRKIRIAYERDWNWKRYLLYVLSIVAVGTFYVLKKFMPGVVMIHTGETVWDLDSLYPLVYTVAVAGFGLTAIRRWQRLRWRAQ